MGFGPSSGLLSPTLQEESPPLEISCPAYHAQGGQPPYQQPEKVEEGMEVDVICDEKDNAMPKEAIALEKRMVEKEITQAGWPLDHHEDPEKYMVH